MVLKSCRCCCSTMRLEKAAKIIGIVFTILGAIATVWSIVNLYQLDSNYNTVKAHLTIILPEDFVEDMLQRSRTALVVRLVSSLLFTLFSAILVAGVQRNSKPMVMAFVIFFILYLVVSTIASFYAFYDPTIIIDKESTSEDESTAKVIIYCSLAIVLAILAFFWYLAIVVYSYYKEMGNSPGRMPEHCQLN